MEDEAVSAGTGKGIDTAKEVRPESHVTWSLLDGFFSLPVSRYVTAVDLLQRSLVKSWFQYLPTHMHSVPH